MVYDDTIEDRDRVANLAQNLHAHTHARTHACTRARTERKTDRKTDRQKDRHTFPDIYVLIHTTMTTHALFHIHTKTYLRRERVVSRWRQRLEEAERRWCSREVVFVTGRGRRQGWKERQTFERRERRANREHTRMRE